MKRDLPAISTEIPSRPRGQIEAIREAVQVLIGTRGDALDRAITFRDLVLNADGSISIGGGEAGGAGPGTGGTIVINPPGAGEEPDLTPPPTPTGLVVTAGLTNVYVEWEVATYLMGHGPGQTNIYGCKWPETDLTPPTFSEAVLVGVAPHAMTLYAIETEPATRWCVWIKFQTADGVESAAPAGGANGAQATTGADVDALLEVLTGQITESQLYAALGQRIDLIDAPASNADSVNARVQSVQTIAMNAQATADGAVAANSATAALVTTVQSQVAGNVGIKTLRYWGFDAGTDGWGTASTATVSIANGVLVWQPTAANPSLAKTFVLAERFQGQRNTIVRARVRRTAGTGAWEGSCYYQTAGHSNSNSFRKLIAPPADMSAWNVLEWDMAALTTGGSDWVDNEILGLRIDLVADTTSTWEIDWVAVGEPSTDPMAASVQQEITTRAEQTGYLGAQYTLRITAGNIVGGFGISGTQSSGAQPTVDFGVRANKFFIAPPEGSGNTGSLPFVVTTTTTVQNGVTVPAGTYINSAFIRNGTITDAMIGNATITAAKITSLNAIHLTAGDGTIGGPLKSANYSAGSAGWIIQSNGVAEFNSVTIRGATYTGTIFANAGTIGAIQINATDLRSSSYAAGSAGFLIQSNGNAFFNNAAVRGSVSGGAFTSSFAFPAAGGTGFHLSASGLLLGNINDGSYFRVLANGNVSAPGFSITGGDATFSGDLNAAGGTFKGTLTAAAVDAIDTINLRGQAVTVTAAGQGSGPIGGSFTTLCSTTINTGGNPLVVVAAFYVNPGTSTSVRVRIVIAGAEATAITLTNQDTRLYVPLIALDLTPPTGSVTVSLQAFALGGAGSVSALDGTGIVAIGCKR